MLVKSIVSCFGCECPCERGPGMIFSLSIWFVSLNRDSVYLPERLFSSSSGDDAGLGEDTGVGVSETVKS